MGSRALSGKDSSVSVVRNVHVRGRPTAGKQTKTVKISLDMNVGWWYKKCSPSICNHSTMKRMLPRGGTTRIALCGLARHG